MPNEDEKMQMLSKFLRDGPEIQRANILPMLNRTTADPIDDVSEESQYEFAVPDLFRMPLRSMGIAGRMASGATPFMQNKVTDAALDSMGLGYGITGLFGGVPKGALGANVWHGGPNAWKPEPKFPQGRPRLDRIGTGEGAQAYGHGFYSADAKAVGQSYADDINVPLQFKGKNIDEIYNDGIKERWADVISKMSTNEVDDFTTIMGNLSQVDQMDSIPSVLYSFTPAQKKMYRDIIEPKLTKPEVSASLKKLDLPDKDIAKMLDWDAPLSEQSKAVQEIARLYNIKTTPSGMKEARGSDIYRAISQAEAKPPFNTASRNPGSVEGSEALRKAGIPGLKYYDQISRHPSGNAPKDTAARILQATGGNRKNAIEETKKRIARSDSKVDSNLKSALEILEGKEQIGTRNYVTWDQDVLDRVKILESNFVLNANASPVGMAGLLMNRRSRPDTSLPTSGKYPVVDDRGNLMYNASTPGGFI